MFINNIKELIKHSIQGVFGNRHLIYRLPVNDAVIALTFDDGPDPRHTPLVLDVLRQNNVKATFFLTGSNVEQHPEPAQQILKEGHCIGNHAYAHKDFTRLNLRQKKEDILMGQNIFNEVLGVTARLFRPPQGCWSLALLVFCMARSIRTILWSVDSRDFEYKGESFLKERLDKMHFKNGDIILLHDDNMDTVNFLQYLIDKARREGFSFATIGDV